MTEPVTEQQIKTRREELVAFYKAKHPGQPAWLINMWAEQAWMEEMA